MFNFKSPFMAKFNFYICTVLEGIKPSVIVHLRSLSDIDTWLNEKTSLMNKTGLSYREIWEKDGYLTLLIYIENFLEKTISMKDNKDILAMFGYPSACTLSEALDILESRYDKHKFPHEIGVFLGYPPNDVLGFIENKGKNCLFSKYWKVYSNVEASLEVFQQMDHARQKALLSF